MGRLGWLVLVLGCGCVTTLRGRALDDNPLTKEDHVSEGIAIETRDAQVIAGSGPTVQIANPQHPARSSYASTGSSYYHPAFYQSAIFEAKSPSHLIFQVELANRWSELTHADSYDISLEDDQGHVFRPADVSGTHDHVIIAQMTVGRTDVVHMVVTTGSGTHIYRHTESSSDPDSQNIRAARSTLEFEGEPMLTASTRRLKLRLHNRNRSLEFVWDFRPLPAH
jgi:hypothetical protein